MANTRGYFLQDFRKDMKHVYIYLLMVSYISLTSVLCGFYGFTRHSKTIYKSFPRLADHVRYCSIGYLIGICLFLLSFAGDNIFGRRTSRFAKGLIHGLASILGTIYLIMGIYVSLLVKPDPNTAKDLTKKRSPEHIQAGYVAVYSTFVPILLGILLYALKDVMGTTMRVILKIVHTISGLVTVAAGAASLHYCMKYDFHIPEHKTFRTLGILGIQATLHLTLVLTAFFTTQRLVFLIVFLHRR